MGLLLPCPLLEPAKLARFRRSHSPTIRALNTAGRGRPRSPGPQRGEVILITWLNSAKLKTTTRSGLIIETRKRIKARFQLMLIH